MSKLMVLLFGELLLAACSVSPIDEPPATSLSPEQTSTSSPETTIMLSQEGGIAGIRQEWKMSTDGWLDLPNGDRIEISPDAVWGLWYSIESSGILSIEQGEPRAVCCDFFSYTLEIQQGDLNHILSYSEGDNETPSEFWDVVNSFKGMVASIEPNDS